MTDIDAPTETNGFEGWVILELMGHRRLGGYLTEATIAGGSFLRLDVPGDQANTDLEDGATQFYSPSAVYCITPTSESTARAVAAMARPAPVQRWELPALDTGTRPPDEVFR